MTKRPKETIKRDSLLLSFELFYINEQTCYVIMLIIRTKLTVIGRIFSILQHWGHDIGA